MMEMKENKFQLQPSNFSNTFAVGYETIATFVQDVTSSVDKNFDDIPEEERKAVSSSKLRLLVGSAIVNQIRAAVRKETQYDCSAGIAHNKILAKLTCGMNKPNKQTILPIESIPGLFNDLPVNKVKSLGGKFGEEVCTKLNAKTMSDILNFTEADLQNRFQPLVGSWLFWMARGIDLEKVTPKFMSKSIAVSKNFRGKNEIASMLTLKFWLKELAKEIVERLEKDQIDYNRLSKHLVVSFSTQGDVKSAKDVASSRTVSLNGNSLNSYTADQIADEAFEVIKKNSAKFLKAEGSVLMSQSIKHLGITAGKFEVENAACSSKSVQDLLKNHKKEPVKAKTPQRAQSKSDSVTSPIESIRKFEMKSPKPMTKASAIPEAKTTSLSPEPQKIEPPPSITTSESFAGDFSIQGVDTLRHWIDQLLNDLCKKIAIDSAIHHRAPCEIYITYQHLVNRKRNETIANLPLEGFKGSLIDGNVIIELLTKSEGFLKAGTKKIQNPIVGLEIAASSFESNKQWNYTVQKAEELSKRTQPENVPDEDPNEVEGIEEDQSVDEDFFIQVQQELKDLNEQEDMEEQGDSRSVQETSADVEPQSPTYDPELIEDGASGVEEIDDEAETLNESVHDQVPIESNAAGPSYLETYAEFRSQNFSMEMLNPKEPCTECGKMIGRLEMVTHLDHHLAFALSKQMREQYRQEQQKVLSQKVLSQRSDKKVVKKKEQQKKPVVLNSIQKYAVKSNQQNDESTENKTKCDQCTKWIVSDEYVSHLDYHHAKKLREEEMKTPAKHSASQNKPANRKRPASTQKNQPKLKSIKSFLTSS